MNLNNLKPAWGRFKYCNGMERIEEQLILSVIEQHDYAHRAIPRLAINAAMFILLTICCQGG